MSTERHAASRRISLTAGVLFLITFITAIPALALFQPVLDDPAGYIAGAGDDNEQRVVNDLVDAGLAELVPNPDHRTSPLARLTPDGNRALDAINRAATKSNDAIQADLTPAQIAKLRQLLRAFTTSARTHHPDV